MLKGALLVLQQRKSPSDSRENSTELPRKTSQVVIGLDLAEYVAYHTAFQSSFTEILSLCSDCLSLFRNFFPPRLNIMPEHEDGI